MLAPPIDRPRIEVQQTVFDGQGEQAILLARRQMNDRSVVNGEQVGDDFPDIVEHGGILFAVPRLRSVIRPG